MVELGWLDEKWRHLQQRILFVSRPVNAPLESLHYRMVSAALNNVQQTRRGHAMLTYALQSISKLGLHLSVVSLRGWKNSVIKSIRVAASREWAAAIPAASAILLPIQLNPTHSTLPDPATLPG